MNSHEVYEYFGKIEVLRIVRPRTERVNYLYYLDCLKVMNFLVNVSIFPLSKKR